MHELPIFSINEKETDQQNALCLDLKTPQALLPAELKNIQWSKKISFIDSFSFLKLIAAHGALYFRDKRLVIDLFSKHVFSYLVEQSNTLWLTGQVSFKERVLKLSAIDLIIPGDPCWFIQGIHLKVMVEEPAWSELKTIPRITTEQEIYQLQKESNVLFGDGVIFKLPEPTPLLKLTDRTNAFAELWFEYDNEKLPFHDLLSLDTHVRNIPYEKGLEKDLLESNFIKKGSGYFCPLDKLTESLSFLLEVGFKIINAEGKNLLKETSRQLNADCTGNKILISGKLNFGSYQVDLVEAVSSHTQRGRFVALNEYSIGLLENMQEVSSIVFEGEFVQNQIQLNKQNLGSLFETKIPSILFSDRLKELKRCLNTPSFVSPDLALFKGSLRPYQSAGVNWMQTLYKNGFSGALGDDMGLGKTVQVLAFLSSLGANLRHLIVVPTSLLFNWQTESEKFIPSIPIHVHQGATRTNNFPSSGLVLTTFAILRNDVSLFSDQHFDCLIVDEAQAIKNQGTQLAQALQNVSANFRLSLSGTLVENRLQELFSHFHFLMPGLLNEGTSSLKEIEQKIRPFFLRRKKEEVAKDLPLKIEQTLYVNLAEGQKALYDSFLSSYKKNLLSKVSLDGMAKHRVEIFEALLRLRQICCHPSLVFPEEGQNSVKLELLLKEIEAVVAEGRKALIFSQFSKMLKIISKELQLRNLRFSYLDGTTTNREKQVQNFQNDPEIPLFLISLKAGGVGLNLTAADTVFIFDPWWNDAIENQAISRAHRIGAQKTVIAKRYITLGTIEEKMMQLKRSKNDLIQNLLEAESPPLSEEDLSLLFEE